MSSILSQNPSRKGGLKHHAEASKKGSRLSEAGNCDRLLIPDGLVPRHRLEKPRVTTSSRAVEPDIRQMLAPTKTAGAEPDKVDSSDLTRVDEGMRDRIPRPCFDGGPFGWREDSIVDFARGSTTESGMGTPGVEPLSKHLELIFEIRQTIRHECSSDPFAFQCSPKSLDEGNGALAADGTKARCDIVLTQPVSEDDAGRFSFVVPKLRALVGDDMFRGPTLAAHCELEHRRDVGSRRFLLERDQSQHLAREVIFDADDLETKGKERRPGMWPPGNGQSPRCGDCGDIDVPKVAGRLRRDSTGALLVSRLGLWRLRPPLQRLPERSAHGGGRNLQSTSREALGNGAIAEEGKLELELLHEIGDVVRKPIHRAGSCDQGVAVEKPKPLGHGGWREEKLFRRASDAPSPSGPQGQYSKALLVGVVGSLGRRKLFESRAEDSDLLSEQGQLGFASFPFELDAYARYARYVPMP